MPYNKAVLYCSEPVPSANGAALFLCSCLQDSPSARPYRVCNDSSFCRFWYDRQTSDSVCSPYSLSCSSSSSSPKHSCMFAAICSRRQLIMQQSIMIITISRIFITSFYFLWNLSRDFLRTTSTQTLLWVCSSLC